MFTDRIAATAGVVLVACSPQNIHRMVTIYRAAKRSGRKFVLDAYGAAVLNATGHPTIPELFQVRRAGAEAIAPKKLVAVHTFARDRFPSLFQNVLAADDGEWIAI